MENYLKILYRQYIILFPLNLNVNLKVLIFTSIEIYESTQNY